MPCRTGTYATRLDTAFFCKMATFLPTRQIRVRVRHVFDTAQDTAREILCRVVQLWSCQLATVIPCKTLRRNCLMPVAVRRRACSSCPGTIAPGILHRRRNPGAQHLQLASALFRVESTRHPSAHGTVPGIMQGHSEPITLWSAAGQQWVHLVQSPFIV